MIEDRETSPSVILIEENRDELVKRMIEVNTPAALRSSMGQEVIATANIYMNRILDSVVTWLEDYAVQQEGMVVAIDYTLAADREIAPQAAMKRIDRTMDVIARFARERFGPGSQSDLAEKQMKSAAALARLVVAGEVLKRTNQQGAIPQGATSAHRRKTSANEGGQTS